MVSRNKAEGARGLWDRMTSGKDGDVQAYLLINVDGSHRDSSIGLTCPTSLEAAEGQTRS